MESVSSQNDSRFRERLIEAPTYLHWHFGSQGHRNPVQARSCELKIWFETEENLLPKSFREEVYGSLLKIQARAGKKKIALFHGGGKKSEALARSLRALDIPFEMFFLNYWGLNLNFYQEWALPFAKEIQVPLHLISMEKVPFYQFAKNAFLDFGIEGPNALAMAFLAEQLPETFFPLVGAGSLERTGDLAKSIGARIPVQGKEFLPFSSVHIFPYLWSEDRGREGEFAFFQSSVNLMRSSLTRVSWEYPTLDLSFLFQTAFPEMKERALSSNWEGVVGKKENFLFRKSLAFVAQTRKEYSFWKPGSGCAASLKPFLHFSGSKI